jgi:hypothetical protein
LADKDIQKIIVPANKLPYSTSDGSYYIRYRISTTEGEAISAWSAKFQVTALAISEIVGASYDPRYSFFYDGRTIKMTWNVSEKLTLDTFDVYAKWSTSSLEPNNLQWSAIDWQYIISTQANSASITVPENEYLQNIVSVSYTSEEVTYTTENVHNFIVGDSVQISGLSPEGYNGNFEIISVNEEDKTFTVSNTTNLDLIDEAGEVSVKQRYAKFWVQAPTQNKEVGEIAKLFETDSLFLNTVIAVDGGTPQEA